MDYESLSEIFKVYLSVSKEDEYKVNTIQSFGHLRFRPEYLIFQYDEKHRGIENMIEHLNGDIKDMVVFGDDYNDLVMFDKRWTSIAMGNAVDILKEKADYVTEDNVNHGIYNACKKFGWI